MIMWKIIIKKGQYDSKKRICRPLGMGWIFWVQSILLFFFCENQLSLSKLTLVDSKWFQHYLFFFHASLQSPWSYWNGTGPSAPENKSEIQTSDLGSLFSVSTFRPLVSATLTLSWATYFVSSLRRGTWSHSVVGYHSRFWFLRPGFESRWDLLFFPVLKGDTAHPLQGIIQSCTVRHGDLGK
jgi:hypothetical protein